MELSWLEDFLELARTGNFSRTAGLRHLTQPAFSRRIRALEDWAGVSLFDRSSQPIILTAAGARFLPLAKMLVQDIAKAREDARLAGAASDATVRFAATHALSLIFFSDWLKKLEQEGPLGIVHLSSDGLPACESLLLEGKVQFLLSHFHPAAPTRLPEDGFSSLRVGNDALIPCATAEAAARWLEAGGGASAPVPLLAYSAESGLGRICRALLAGSPGLQTQPVITADLAGLLKVMCLDGRGIAWLPQSLVAADLARGLLRQVGPPEWRVPLEIRVFRNCRPETPAAESFWRALSSQTSSLPAFRSNLPA